MKKIFEWQCRACQTSVWSARKDQPGALIKRVPVCPDCKQPTFATGRTQQAVRIGRARY